MQTRTETMPVMPDDFLFPLDPFQSRAVQKASGEDHSWIYGGDETKQMEVLLHLLLRNAAHGQSTLLCAHPEIQHTVLEQLRSMGLDHFAFQLKTPAPRTVLAALQVARKKPPQDDTLTQCDLAVNQFNTWKHTQEASYDSIERQIFGDMTWKQIVDQTATAPRDTFKSQLAASLVTSDFELSQKEYWHIKGRIKTFQRLRILRTPAFDVLNHLHDSIFENAEETHVKEHLEAQLQQVMRAGRALLRQIGELVHQYRRDITGAQHEALEMFKSRIHDIETLMVSGEMQFGAEFYAESTFNDFTDRIRRTVSSKSRAMHNMRGDIREEYRNLIEDLMSTSIKGKHIEEALLEDPLTIEYIAEGLKRCSQLLTRWSDHIDAEATDHKRRLNAQNIPVGHVLRQMIEQVEQHIQEYVDYVNGQKVFGASIEVNALSLEKRSMVIKDVVTRCMKVQEAMSDFEAYYLWRSFWSQLEDNVRTLLEGLDIMDDKDQMHAFKAWYFENVLDQIPAAQIVQQRVSVDKYEERRNEMRAVVLNHIKQSVRYKRHVVLKAIRSTQKPLIMSIVKAKTGILNDELRILPAKDLMQLFPVVFCTPADLRDYGYYSDMLCVVDETGVDYRAYMAQAQKCVMLTRKMPRQMDPSLSKLGFAGLGVQHLDGPFPWNDLPATGKLQRLQSLASQFTPFARDLKIYNGRGIQILSFLGDICDNHILKALDLPYKQMGDDGQATAQHITETLLDVRKPVVLLVHDEMLGYRFRKHLIWQYATLDLVTQCDIPVFNVWSMDLKRTGISALDPIINDLRNVVTAQQMRQAKTETTILPEHDLTGSVEIQNAPAPAPDRRTASDLRSNPSEVGGIPA